MRVDGSNKPITFTEWSMIGDKVQRREFVLDALLKNEANREYNLFSVSGEDIYIPTPIKEHPLVPFTDLSEDV
jgi:hemolysin-activating ACP:hemolysin acyltransferase